MNGKVERSYRIDAQESCRLLGGVAMGEPQQGPGGQTLYERLRQKTGIPM